MNPPSEQFVKKLVRKGKYVEPERLLILMSSEKGILISGKFQDYQGFQEIVQELYEEKVDPSALWISYTAKNGQIVNIKTSKDLQRAYTWAIYFDEKYVTFQVAYDESKDASFARIGYSHEYSAF